MTTYAEPSTAHGIDKFKTFAEMDWLPHKGQEAVARCHARNRLVAAGRRFGKSDLGGHELVPEALLTYGMMEMLKKSKKRREFWIVGPEYSDSEKEFRVAYNELSALGVPFDHPGTYNDPDGGNMHISLWGGTFHLYAKSAKYPKTLVGEGLSGVILAEAAKLKESVWIKFIRPMLADFNGWSLHSSTPEGKNWFYDNYMRGQRPGGNWQSFRMPAWRNNYVYRTETIDRDVDALVEALRHGKPIPEGLTIDNEVIELAEDMSAESFNQEIAAKFTEFVGRVFKDFDDDVHVGDFEYDPTWKTFACSDYGFVNPFVWLLIQVGPWGEVRVLDEFYQSGLTIPEIAEELTSRGLAPQSILGHYPDPALPSESAQLSTLLKIPTRGGTGGELKDRIEMIRRWLKVPKAKQHLPEGHPERLPMLHINRKCVNTIREMNDYRYPKSAEEAASAGGNNAPENPMKKDDHTPEALGRFFAGYFGSPSKETGTGSRVRKSNLSR